MGRPCNCGCGSEQCECKTITLLEWSGDRDFTGDLDIRNYPGFRSSILTRQRAGTSLLWRIRYNPDRAFMEYLVDTKTIYMGDEYQGIGFVSYFPFSNAAAIHSGPIRDGIMYGLDMVPAGNFPLNIYRWPTWPPPNGLISVYDRPVDRYFQGSANLYAYNTNGSPFPASWTRQDHPDNPVSIPWALEVGCARCIDNASVSWPDHTDWHYDHLTDYGGIPSPADPVIPTVVGTPVDGSCQAVTDNDLQSIYWPGDEVEPDNPATCPPDCIVWVSDMWPITPTALLNGVPGGARSIPGASLPSDAITHPATTLAAAGGNTVQLDGWSGRFAGDDVVRAARGDSAAIANVDCIWLVDVYNTFGALQEFTWSYSLAEGDVQWIKDWLALGGKTLIVDAPWKHVSNTFAVGVNPTGAVQPNIAIGNTFLGWLGSGLSLYAIESHLTATGFPYRVIVSLDCVSSQSHALAPVPETLFTGIGWPDGSSLLTQIALSGGGALDAGALGISGGTALYQYDSVIRTVVAPLSTGPSAASDGDETHPVIAVEELGNGSRIIAGSISISGRVHAELSRGLSHVPGIGNLIVRAVQS